MNKLVVLVLCVFCFLLPSNAMSRYDMIEFKSLLREEKQILNRIQKLASMMESCPENNSKRAQACRIKQDKIRNRYIEFENMLIDVRMELEEFESDEE